MKCDYRDKVSSMIEARRQSYTDISDAIWGFAESRFQEYESSKIQQEYLKSRGFAVKADLAGEETAFIAEWGTGKPVIAFVGEFDALSSLQQEADKT
ncbi:MAG: amidohydrolase, partial [Lachnospiraceae bacterium]|nr:amidohydrolase [Lachnospiraceae bacterium]